MKKQPHSFVTLSVQVLQSTLHLLGRSILLSSHKTSEWHHGATEIVALSADGYSCRHQCSIVP